MKTANLIVALAAILVAACSTPVATTQSPPPGANAPTPAPDSSASGAPPSVQSTAAADYELAYGLPQPVDVAVELSPITFTTPVTTENGGFLALAASDGTFFQLDIPPKAVISDVDMTMTVVSSISGSPLGDQLVGAVELEPAGLTFMNAATLTITPISPVAQDAEGPFTAESGGANFHLYPLDRDPTVLRMPITHFSIFGLFLTDAERRAAMINRTAATVGAQLEQEMHALLDQARKAKGSVDTAKAESVFNTYRDRVVRPMLALARSDHALFMQAFKRWVSYERQRGLLIDGSADLDPDLLKLVREGFANYVEKTRERCYAHDFGAIHDLWSLARADELQNGMLLGPSQADAAEFMDKCLTFTLEMTSTVEYQTNMCMFFLDIGISKVTGAATVTTAVEIRPLQGDTWAGPMTWGSVTGKANCRLPAPKGNYIDCQILINGPADPRQFTVTKFDFDLNDTNRPPPPPPPSPTPSPVPGAPASPTPSSSPSGPPTPKPTEVPELTISELRIRNVVVQPGDPQAQYNNQCRFFGIPNASADSGSGNWLPVWTSNSPYVGRKLEPTPSRDVFQIDNWEPLGEGDVLARREYQGGFSNGLGSQHEMTTFVIRHTPRR